jgi:hypothetical protein
MKRILVLGLAMMFACGGDDNKENPPPECGAIGLTCTTGTECCSGNCDMTVNQCAPPTPGECLAADAVCQSSPECCTFSCVNYRCSADQCTSDNASCDNDGECCSGVCTDGACAPLNMECRTAGNACTLNSECCSGFCKDGTVCSSAPSYCTQGGDACSINSECCSGTCIKTADQPLGLCQTSEQLTVPGSPVCRLAGEVCGAGADYNGEPLAPCGGDCCSRACFPYGPTGILICQPSSGCRPTGETCVNDSDCCGSEGTLDGDTTHVTCSKQAGATIGRCDNGNVCSPAGDTCKIKGDSCNADANCCAGNINTYDTCHKDALGVPRCGELNLDCTDPSSKIGMACGSSADCCGLPCAPDGTGAYKCGATCVPEGGTCTTGTDCCAGLPCTVPAGSTMGTCGAPQGCIGYGQACDPAAPMCCDNVSCIETNGVYTCGVIIL